jgi:hypothetical protein
VKETKVLFIENYKPLKTEIKEHIRRWKDLPCSWIGKISIKKMTILKIPMTSFTEIEKSFLKYNENTKALK